MASSEAECASSLGVEAGAQQTRSLSPILRLSQERTRSSEADEQQTRSLSPNPHPSHKRTRSPSPACDSGLKSDDTERLIARASRWGFQFPTKRVKVDASQDILLQADSPMVAQWPLGPVAKLEYGDTILPPDITPFDQQPQLDSQLAKQEVGKSTPPLGIAPLVEQEISADTPPPAIGPTEMQPLQTGAYLVGQRFSDSAPPPVVALKQRQPAPKDSKLAKQETSADLSHPKTAPERAESPNIRFSLVKSRTIDGAGPSTSMNVRDSFELPPLWSELNAVNDSQHQPPAPVMRPEKQPVPKSYPPRNTPRSPAPSGKMTEQIRVWSQIFRNGPLTEKLSSALPPHPPAGQVPLLETLSRGWSVIAHGAYGMSDQWRFDNRLQALTCIRKCRVFDDPPRYAVCLLFSMDVAGRVLPRLTVCTTCGCVHRQHQGKVQGVRLRASKARQHTERCHRGPCGGAERQRCTSDWRQRALLYTARPAHVHEHGPCWSCVCIIGHL